MVVIACAWFALSTPEAIDAGGAAMAASGSKPADPPPPFVEIDLSGFERVQLWAAPPPASIEPVKPGPQTTSAPPLKVDLVAIITEDNSDGEAPVHLVAIYIHADERVEIVRAGEKISSFVIVEVTETSVTLMRGDVTRVLMLDHAVGVGAEGGS